MSDMPQELKSLRAEINAHMEAYLAALPNTLEITLSSDGELALELLQEFALRPGKRIRGALAMVAYKMFGGTKHQVALDVALAVELAQDYLLIIDDVMDRSERRRGGATVHEEYRHILGRYTSEEFVHIADMLSVNVGLIAQHFSSMVLSELDDNPARIVRAQRLFQSNLAVTGFGQLDDLMGQAGKALKAADTRRMYIFKSSYYTFVNPLQLGAALAGADKMQLEAIRGFGEYAGLAFQMQDDLLGMFGDGEVTGKSSLDDLREGKMTLLMQHAFEHANSEQLTVLRAAHGNRSVTEQQHTQVCEILTTIGSHSHISQEARNAAQAASAALVAQETWPTEGKTLLLALVEYTVNRGR
ncbi:MAG TPA: polyprenyl synthetase family protein [Verrucomicrobiae bacterium]|nr:polyprenyl synthetase family protein [Verrucomicrobiae bacterium]